MKSPLYFLKYCALLSALLLSLGGTVKADAGISELLAITDLDLACVEYPWGKELEIHLRGKAQPLLNKAVLTINITYLRQTVQIFNHIIRAPKNQGKGKIDIDERWENLNESGQEILAGNYSVRIELEFQQQSPELQNIWVEKYGANARWEHSGRFDIDPSAFTGQSAELKKFYLARMRRLNDLYREMEEKKKEALAKKNNSFVEQGKFSEAKWRQWFLKFMQDLEQEKAILGKHRKKVYAPRYPMTLTNMDKYASIIERMANFNALEVYQFHKLSGATAKYQVDPYAISNARDIVRLIQDLHGRCAAELGISLRKELGYLPPPGAH